VAWSALFGYGSLGIALARNIFLVPLYLRYISVGEFGAWLATGGALVQILVSDLGLTGVLTQRVAHRFGGRAGRHLGALIGAGLTNSLALALILTAICVALAPFLPATQGLTPVQSRRVMDCFLLAVGANCLGVVSSAATGVLRSLQRALGAGLVALTADVASVVVTILALLLGNAGLYALPLGMLIRSLVSLAGSLGLLATLCAREPDLRPGFSWKESRELWHNSLQFFLTSVGMRLQSNANTLCVGAIAGPESAAAYGLTVRAHETLLLLIQQLNVALVPSLAHLVGAEQPTRFRELLLRLLPTMAALVATGAGVIIALNASFVSLWVGARFFAGQGVTALMAAAAAAAVISYVAYDALLARGEFRVIARIFIVAGLVHVALLLALLRFGMWGAPLAMLIATGLWGTTLWRRVAADVQIGARELPVLGTDLLVVLFAGVVGAAVVRLGFPVITSWTQLFVAAVVCLLVSAGAILLLRPNLRRLLLEELAMTVRSLRHSSSG